MTLGRDFKKRGAALMHQQCGLWGYDVRREVGGVRQNLLLEIGFERTPPPQGVPGATTYARHEADGSRVTLWGFGMHFGDEAGGIFLSRFAFWPRYSPLNELAQASSPQPLLETHHVPKRAAECLAATQYFCRALSWIGNYEREVNAHCGVHYRAAALQFWSKSEVADLANEWQALARECPGETHFWRFNKHGTASCRLWNKRIFRPY
ncbi:hypothetical protein EON80_28730 [bacterium]|nr:MAG: hypothetical protein EON80_28730 [bacterium]